MSNVSKIKQIKKNKKTIIFSYLQKLGSTLMYAIVLLPFAGIMLGIGILIGDGVVSTLLTQISLIIFELLPIFVYYSYIVFFNKKSDDNQIFIVATYFLLIYFSLQTSIANLDFIPDIFINKIGESYSLISQSTYDIYTFGFSIFSSILIAIVFLFVDNRWNKYIVTLSSIVVAIVLIPILILVTTTLYSIGLIISFLPFGINAFFYGFINRLLLPFGMHSIMIPTFLYSSVGGVMTLTSIGNDTITIVGDSMIWQFMYVNDIPFNELTGEVTIDGILYTYNITNTTNIGSYQQGFFPIMIFGFPMAGLAIVKKLGWEDGKQYFIASLIPMLTGITEPFEFLFVFTSPILYFINAFLTGLSFMFMSIANCSIWMSSGWFLDVIFFGLIPNITGNETNWYWIFIIGPFLSFFYFISFYYLFEKNNILT